MPDFQAGQHDCGKSDARGELLAGKKLAGWSMLAIALSAAAIGFYPICEYHHHHDY